MNIRPAHLVRPRSKRQVALWLIASGLFLSLAIGATALLVHSQERTARTDLVTHTVHYEPLRPTVVARGSLESASQCDIVCRVRSGSRGGSAAATIKWVIDEGTLVKRGQLLVELDDSGLEEDLQQQKVYLDQAWAASVQAEESYKIVTAQNRGDIERAEVAVRLAELDLQKYVQGDYEQARKDLEGRLALAEADLEAWRERSAWSERMVRKGYVASSQARSERARLDSSGIALDKLREELRVLQQYTRKRSVTELQSRLAEAQGNLARIKHQAQAKKLQADTGRLVYKRIYQRRETRYHEIEDEIRKCVITAPQDGLVVYSVSSQNRHGGGSQQSVIAQGEPVREGQTLLHLPDLSRMVVNVRVHEALVARVRGERWEPTGFSDGVEAALLISPDPATRLLGACSFAELRDRFRNRERRMAVTGQPALIRLDADPERVLHGHVREVAVLPSQADWSMADVKMYQTLVTIDESPSDLRPDMSAEVTILLDGARDHVLTVPVQALVGTPDMGRQRKCFVMTDEGVEERDVTVGTANEKLAEVQAGLEEGDEVVLNPRGLWTERGRAAAHGSH